MGDPVRLAPGVDEVAAIVAAALAFRRFGRIELTLEKAARRAEPYVVLLHGRENPLVKAELLLPERPPSNDSSLQQVVSQKLQFLP